MGFNSGFKGLTTRNLTDARYQSLLVLQPTPEYTTPAFWQNSVK